MVEARGPPFRKVCAGIDGEITKQVIQWCVAISRPSYNGKLSFMKEQKDARNGHTFETV
jgi:hypothetical protein